ncbi:MAG: roadblock/LC7 domain-containing protein [bacterium]|nr:roadblock/LC7 domain-containing protein [bacterium]
MSFEEALNSLLERCPGATGVAIVDADGIEVAVVPSANSLDALGAELATVVREVEQAGRELEHGKLRQFSVQAERAMIILTTLAAGYFLVLMLSPEGLAGKARYLSRLAGQRLYSEFI